MVGIEIILDDLSKEITQKFDIAFFRYVDDILILCDYSQAQEINRKITIHISFYQKRIRLFSN